ncbi:pyridine nucleotide transhydrogenase [Pseudomarimonas arenosa]|uniref:Pyridine nucleotide transhydrogenase n=1 Tax=Pseudomarimonas arenosa TaxID=2774145 RepID=A0AAW3ZKQ2_9GAMM|nr:pyridine nucleotide transhydrogenase [Pseudomarimonas arenosa]MBD8524886.1 pyridine nucleotide transhydrogenase [Pseudomarimonas arenosa]
MDALIGCTGFVGSTLQRQRSFAAGFRSTNIASIRGQSFAEIVCAGAPAKKWLANQDPDSDLASIQGLMSHLEQVSCERFVLISTVDVFPEPVAVDEESPIDQSQLQPYGRHRRMLEQFVADRFPDHLIVRLPGLVGPGLQKNAIFDLHNNNQLEKIDGRARFQFYPMVNLHADLQRAQALGLSLLHLTAAPLAMADVAESCFGIQHRVELPVTPASYDFRSRHAVQMGGAGVYQYSERESVTAIRCYAQSEPRKA